MLNKVVVNNATLHLINNCDEETDPQTESLPDDMANYQLITGKDIPMMKKLGPERIMSAGATKQDHLDDFSEIKMDKNQIETKDVASEKTFDISPELSPNGNHSPDPKTGPGGG